MENFSLHWAAAPAEPRTPKEIPDNDDPVGQANVGRAVKPAQTSPYSSQPVSRTTDWRQRKRLYDQSARGEPACSEKAPSKEYSCRVCNQTMAGTGRTQFRGKRYCPNAPSVKTSKIADDETIGRQWGTRQLANSTSSVQESKLHGRCHILCGSWQLTLSSSTPKG